MILAVSASAQTVEVGNDQVKAVAIRGETGFTVRYLARSPEGWVELLAGGPDPSVRMDGADELSVFTRARVDRMAGGEVLVLEAENPRVLVRKSIRTDGVGSFLHVQVDCEFRAGGRLNHALSTYSFLPGSPDFVFTPQLRPEADEVIADHTFRAPALMLQRGRQFAALVPDLPTIDGRNRLSRSGADLRVAEGPYPILSFGLLPWQKKNHVYYAHNDSTTATIRKGSKAGYGYFIYVTAQGEPGAEFQKIVRFQWDRFGRGNFLQPKGPQSQPFATYEEKAWKQFVPMVAMDADLRGTRITLLRQERLAWSNKLHAQANNDNWFNVWFNSLRTAYGMYLYAGETGDKSLRERAVGNLNLALLAPDYQGISPSIFYLESSGGHWVADHAWGGIRGGSCLAMFHNAWTVVWLLRWGDLVPERKDEIIARARRFGDFLVRNQRPSGVIPSWYDPVTLEPVPEFRDENAETAGAAFALTELYRRTGESGYLTAARRAMEYITTEILPERKWFDYETFFSCSRKPLGFFDAVTGQYPQNTLSMHQAAEAYLSLFELTGTEEYKRLGIRVLDYLCLYQQIWSPQWLSCELMGGFGVQNTDGEWSDSRQGYFAETLIRYAGATGRREYFERGVAALRAMFSLFESPDSPRTAENYAHAAADQLAGVTGIHWGTGSSVVSIHRIEQTYGDAYVDVAGDWGVGIDGCRIPDVLVEGETIRLKLLDNVNAPRSVRLTFGGLDRDSYSVVVNGKHAGTHSAEALKKGIRIAI